MSKSVLPLEAVKGSGADREDANVLLSVVVPAYNEASVLRANIESLQYFLTKAQITYEIIVAEDGSTDGTAAVADEIAASLDNVRVMHSPFRLGKGLALSAAFRNSSGSTLMFMDADLATDLKHLPAVIGVAKSGKTLAIGSRRATGAVVERPMTRALASRAYNWLVRFLFRTGVLDHQCGFKALPRSLAMEVLPYLRDSRWVWDTELIVKAKELGYDVIEIPVEWREKKQGPDVPIRKVVALSPIMAWELLHLKLEFLRRNSRRRRWSGKRSRNHFKDNDPS